MVVSCAAFGCEKRWKLKKDLAPGEKKYCFSPVGFRKISFRSISKNLAQFNFEKTRTLKVRKILDT